MVLRTPGEALGREADVTGRSGDRGHSDLGGSDQGSLPAQTGDPTGGNDRCGETRSEEKDSSFRTDGACGRSTVEPPKVDDD